MEGVSRSRTEIQALVGHSIHFLMFPNQKIETPQGLFPPLDARQKVPREFDQINSTGNASDGTSLWFRLHLLRPRDRLV